MNMATTVQIMDKSVYFSHNANMLGTGMNPTILSPAMGK